MRPHWCQALDNESVEGLVNALDVSVTGGDVNVTSSVVAMTLHATLTATNETSKSSFPLFFTQISPKRWWHRCHITDPDAKTFLILNHFFKK